MLVDTPGFDDTNRDNSEILEEILKLLTYQYQNKAYILLKGVVYLHRITDMRFTGASMEALKIFQKMSGEEALANVILATTRWDEVDKDLGAAREQELRTNFWRFMLEKNTNMTRFYDSTESAMSMVSQLVNKSGIVFDIQHEVVDEGKATNETAAGSIVHNQLAKFKAKTEETVKELTVSQQEMDSNNRVGQRRVQQEITAQQALLHKVNEGQKVLKKRVAIEVDEKIEEWKRRWRINKRKNLPMIPNILFLFGLFAKISKDCKETLGAWFRDLGSSDSVDELMEEFEEAEEILNS